MNLSSALGAFCFCLVANSVRAYAVVGYTETIHELVPVGVKGSQGESLVLAHKTSIFWLLAGVYVRDDGYVLAVGGASRSYYPMPKSVHPMQRAGLLPKPLPRYSIPIYEYVIGHSFWIVLASAGIIKLARAERCRRRRIDYLTGPAA